MPTAVSAALGAAVGFSAKIRHRVRAEPLDPLAAGIARAIEMKARIELRDVDRPEENFGLGVEEGQR